MKISITSLLFIVFIISKIGYSQDFEVAPVVMKFNAEPGETQQQKLHIRNHSNKKQTFSFILSDYTINEEGRKIPVAIGESPNSCADWITINPSFVELNPNESIDATVMMNVPRANSTSKWGIIYVQAATEQSASGADKEMATGVKILPRIVVYVSQSPKSNNNFRANIVNIKEITKSEDKNKRFSAVINNTGDKVIEAKVFLAYANLTTAEEIKQKPQNITVYPGTSRTVELNLTNKLEPGKYVIAAMLDYGNRQAIESTQMMIEIK